MSMTSLRCLAVAALLFLGCHRPGAAAGDAAVAPPTPVASGSPLSRISPPSRPGPRLACPLTIEPGVAFGPVVLGETLADLERAGLTVKKITDSFAEVTLGGSTLKVGLCQGKIIDIWIDDLRTAPACVAYAGTTFAPSVPREDLEKAVGGCAATEPRIGGAFESCQGGGLYVGHGMGTFLQLRVRPKGWSFDNTCAVASDDGSPIVLTAAEGDSMLRQTLNLPSLSPYWHPNVPGRDPLRIVKTPLVSESKLMMFGSQVVWIDDAEAKKGVSFLRITSLSASKTKATLTFEYPIEGVLGTATFSRFDGDKDWRLVHGAVRER